MATIKELMEGKAPGSIKIQRKCWEPDRWFIPYYSAGNLYYGVRDSDRSDSFSTIGDDWELWTEPPPPKVTVWVEWLVIPVNGAKDSAGATRFYVDGYVPKHPYIHYIRTGRAIMVESERVNVEVGK